MGVKKAIKKYGKKAVDSAKKGSKKAATTTKSASKKVGSSAKQVGRRAVASAKRAERKVSGAVGSKKPIEAAKANRKPTDKRVAGVRGKSKAATTRKANANRAANKRAADAASKANVRSGRKRIGAAVTAASLAPTLVGSAKKPAGGKSNPNPRSRRKTALSRSTTKKTAADGKTASYRNTNRRAQASSTVTGGVKTKDGTYKTYKKNSAAARSFRSAFLDAQKSSYKTFTWEGKRYTTKTK